MSGPEYGEILPKTRTCSKCGRTREEEQFGYFRQGFHDVCMDCFIEMEKSGEAYPHCPICHTELFEHRGKWSCHNGCLGEPTPTTPAPVCGKDKAVHEDPVLSPSHYTHGGIETIDFIRAKLTPDEFRGFCKGSVIKYLSRANLKGNEEQDYRKASFYASMLAGDDPRGGAE